MDYTIRLATPADAEALSVLGAATVLETYNTLVPGDDLLTFCRVKHAPTQYLEWLNDPACVVWIARATLGAPIAYLVLTPATLPIDASNPGDLEILRIYVLAPYHKAGLGHALMQLAINESRNRQAKRLVLGMNDQNTRALAFYRRQGFDVIGERQFLVGDTYCSDFVLALPLK